MRKASQNGRPASPLPLFCLPPEEGEMVEGEVVGRGGREEG